MDRADTEPAEANDGDDEDDGVYVGHKINAKKSKALIGLMMNHAVSPRQKAI